MICTIKLCESPNTNKIENMKKFDRWILDGRPRPASLDYDRTVHRIENLKACSDASIENYLLICYQYRLMNAFKEVEKEFNLRRDLAGKKAFDGKITATDIVDAEKFNIITNVLNGTPPHIILDECKRHSPELKYAYIALLTAIIANKSVVAGCFKDALINTWHQSINDIKKTLVEMRGCDDAILEILGLIRRGGEAAN